MLVKSLTLDKIQENLFNVEKLDEPQERESILNK